MPDVQLTVDGRRFEGWTSVEIRRGIQQMSGSFSLTHTEHWPGQQAGQAMKPGDRCTVAIDGDTVITGHVDEVAPSYSADGHEIRVAGRDLTADLIDCSAASTPGEWHNRDLRGILRDLVAPFGIAAIVAADVGAPFRKFRIEEGESVFEAIDRACRMRAVLATSDEQGRLLIIRAGAARSSVALRRGENILSAGVRFNWRDRFSTYVVKAQQPGGDFLSPAQTAQIVVTATDPAVTRHRPLTVLAEHAADQGEAADRVLWEANVRAARARQATVTVQGWRQGAGGPLWMPNTIAPLHDEWLDIDQDMLITAVTWRRSNEGTVSELQLMPPGAFELRAEPEPEDEGAWIS